MYGAKTKREITLEDAVKFHGHLGPYLILGILAGELALKRLKAKRYFGLEVKVWGASKKPESCLIDGLQLSTGATYGKGNIHKFNSARIKVEFCNHSNNKKLALQLKTDIIERLKGAKTHRDSELLAKELYKIDSSRIFELCTLYPVLCTKARTIR